MIDWDNGIITVPALKTAKMGFDRRRMPLYAELRSVLEREFTRQGSPAKGYVVVDVLNLDRYSDRTGINGADTNGGETLKKYVRFAGVKPWKKIFQNQRVSRENELLQSGEYRSEAVHAFIGHSRSTYLTSYFKLDDSDFLPPNGPRIHRQEAPKGDLSFKHKKKTPRFTGNREVSDVSRDDLITPQGLEPQLTEPESVVLPITPRGSVVTSVTEVRQSINAFKRCKE